MRTLIVANNQMSARGIRRELRYAPALEVVGYVEPGASCVATIAKAGPELVVIDELGATESALALIAGIRSAAPKAKLLLLSGHMEQDWLARAAAAGIDGAVTRTIDSASLGTLVRHAALGNVFHAFAPAPARVPTPRADVSSKLTDRELQVVRLLAAGTPNARIAAKLGVTEQTIKFHLSNTYRKLGVANRTEASHHAHLTGLLAATTPTAGVAVEAA
jgi:DNA-binding NarL/FixJ family response regulator